MAIIVDTACSYDVLCITIEDSFGILYSLVNLICDCGNTQSSYDADILLMIIRVSLYKDPAIIDRVKPPRLMLAGNNGYGKHIIPISPIGPPSRKSCPPPRNVGPPLEHNFYSFL